MAFRARSADRKQSSVHLALELAADRCLSPGLLADPVRGQSVPDCRRGGMGNACAGAWRYVDPDIQVGRASPGAELWIGDPCCRRFSSVFLHAEAPTG